MKEFENFKNLYQDTTVPEIDLESETLIQKAKYIKKGLIITQIVLGITVAILIGFFFYISAQKVPTVAFALSVMIFALILRILIEYISMSKFKKLNFLDEVTLFNRNAERYQKFRTGIQFVVTPLLFFSYFIGFILLLPYFKASLSSGFYTYILISGSVVFVALGIYIATEIKKELKVLSTWKKTETF